MDRLFGADECGNVANWAAQEAREPGSVSRLSNGMQTALLQRCQLRLRKKLWKKYFGGKVHTCELHTLWARLIASAPPAWTGAGFLDVGGRSGLDSPGWAGTSVGAAQLCWRVLVDMGECCEGERKTALAAMEARKAPLGALLLQVMLEAEDDEFRQGEERLAWHLLERAPVEDVRRAKNRWIFEASPSSDWKACICQAEKVLRWRGLRAAWASAVVRAGQAPP